PLRWLRGTGAGPVARRAGSGAHGRSRPWPLPRRRGRRPRARAGRRPRGDWRLSRLRACRLPDPGHGPWYHKVFKHKIEYGETRSGRPDSVRTEIQVQMFNANETVDTAFDNPAVPVNGEEFPRIGRTGQV